MGRRQQREYLQCCDGKVSKIWTSGDRGWIEEGPTHISAGAILIDRGGEGSAGAIRKKKKTSKTEPDVSRTIYIFSAEDGKGYVQNEELNFATRAGRVQESRV